MTRTLARLAAVASASVTMLAVAPAVAPAGTIHSTSASINFVGYAHLQEDKTVMVTVTYSCQPNAVGPTGSLRVRLEQEGAIGFGPFTNVTCDDQKHSATVDVAPGPFKPGRAGALAVINNLGSSTAETWTELQVK